MFILLLAVVTVGFLPGLANSHERNNIRIYGRILDEAGAPLSETWVVTKGSRRGGVLVDADGQYSLTVPGTNLFELERVPLKLRIQARRRGWYLTLPGGIPELGVEMRLVADSSGVARFQVRSNDPSIAATLANAAVLETSTRVAIKLDFVGVRGRQPETDALDLPEMEEVVLAGATHPAAAPSSMADSSMAAEKRWASSSTGASGSGSAAGKVVPASADSAHSGKKRSRARSATPEEIRQAMEALGEAKPVPSQAGIDGSSVDSLKTWAGRSVTGSGIERQHSGQPTAVAFPDRPAVAPKAPAAPPDKPVSPPHRSTAPPDTAAVSPEPAASPDRGAASPDKPVASADRPAAPPNKPALLPDMPAASREIPAAPRDTAALSPDRAAVVPDRSAASPYKPAVTPARPAASSDRPAVAPAKSPAPPDKPPAPLPSTTIPAQAARSTQAIAQGAPSSPAGRACQCHVQGTIEVVSDRPLPERMQVVVYLEEDHKVTDTVELFMGSPRQFDLFGVPCGAHQLRIKARSKQRFTLTSPEPIVDCSAGGYHQVKLVLEPFQRWRVSR